MRGDVTLFHLESGDESLSFGDDRAGAMAGLTEGGGVELESHPPIVGRAGCGVTGGEFDVTTRR